MEHDSCLHTHYGGLVDAIPWRTDALPTHHENSALATEEVNTVAPAMNFIPSSIENSVCTKGSVNRLRMMSFNVRLDVEMDGNNAWLFRKDAVGNLLRHLQPDVIGLQEPLAHQVADIASSLGEEYAWVGVGRDDGVCKGEFAPVFYNTNSLRALRWKTLWLSDTPQSPGTRFDSSACNRTATVVDFESLYARNSAAGYDRTPLMLRFINTHLDHIGHYARVQSSRLLLAAAASCGGADCDIVAIVGDFNCESGSEPYSIIANAMQDARFVRSEGTDDVNEGRHSHVPQDMARQSPVSLSALGNAAARDNALSRNSCDGPTGLGLRTPDDSHCGSATFTGFRGEYCAVIDHVFIGGCAMKLRTSKCDQMAMNTAAVDGLWRQSSTWAAQVEKYILEDHSRTRTGGLLSDHRPVIVDVLIAPEKRNHTQ